MLAGASNHQSSTVPHARPTSILGGAERLTDETGEKIREDFLSFLQRCRDDGNSFVQSSQPTSEMLTATTFGSSEVNPPSLGVGEMPVYIQQLHEMRNDGQNTLFVDFGHVVRFNEVLATAIIENFYR